VLLQPVLYRTGDGFVSGPRGLLRLRLGLEWRSGREVFLGGDFGGRLGHLLDRGKLRARLFGHCCFVGRFWFGLLAARGAPQEPPTPAACGRTLLGRRCHVRCRFFDRRVHAWGFGNPDISGRLGLLGRLCSFWDIDVLCERIRELGFDGRCLRHLIRRCGGDLERQLLGGGGELQGILVDERGASDHEPLDHLLPGWRRRFVGDWRRGFFRGVADGGLDDLVGRFLRWLRLPREAQLSDLHPWDLEQGRSAGIACRTGRGEQSAPATDDLFLSLRSYLHASTPRSAGRLQASPIGEWSAIRRHRNIPRLTRFLNVRG